MSFPERLKQAREKKGLKQSELAEIIGVGNTAISNYEKGTSHPKLDILYKLFEVLDADPNFLYQDEMEPNKNQFAYSFEEQTHIDNYRKLDPHGKQAVNSILSVELERLEQANKKRLGLAKNKVVKFPAQHFRSGVSAGTGQYLDYSESEIIYLSEEPPNGMNYTVTVIGDSMEPTFYDGDLVAVSKADNINIGEIGSLRTYSLVN